MKIIVLNGSPKGKNSITLQTVLYLQNKYTQHKFVVLHVGQKIKQYEKDFSNAQKEIENADLIIFTYPVYTFLAPYQLHRFIEIMKENNVVLENKFATQITTSKHFYDITAHKFIEQNCYDMNMKYIDGLSADMEDLLNEKGQYQAICFFDKLMFNIKNDIYKKKDISVNRNRVIYKSTIAPHKKQGNKDVVIVTNCSYKDENLKNMIADFKLSTDNPVREINIRDFPFAGGCLGCFGCAVTGKCVYKDNFDDFLRTEIQSADAIIYAFTIKNHYTHSSFKCYDDRQFCNGHRAVTTGMPVGYIISGDYEDEHNLQTLVEARSEVGGVYLCGVATDEKDTKNNIIKLAKSLDYALCHEIDKPTNFYGVGGTKIFRDLIYIMQGMMKADHKFYKKNGIYDFPQKQKGKIIQMKLIGSLMSLPSIQKKMKGKMNEYIITPYKKVIDNVNSNKK